MYENEKQEPGRGITSNMRRNSSEISVACVPHKPRHNPSYVET